MPADHLSVAFPSSAAARVQKLPFGTRVIVLPGLTTPTQQPLYTVTCRAAAAAAAAVVAKSPDAVHWW